MHSDNIFQRIVSDAKDYAMNTILFSILMPISFLALLGVAYSLPWFAFHDEYNWGVIPKLIVGIGEPFLIFMMFYNKQFCAAVLILWYIFLWGGLLVSIFLVFFYFLLANVDNYTRVALGVVAALIVIGKVTRKI